MVSQFQYVAVLVAIIFGLSLTHVLSSTARAFFMSAEIHYEKIRLVWTGFILLILLLDWWVTFSWRDIEVWSFDLFLVLIIWAGSHYALVIALYPFSGMSTEIQMHDWRPEPLLIIFIILALLDFAQTWVRGELFSSEFYIPFTLHYVALAAAALIVRRRAFYNFAAWYFLISFVSWALIVRRFLI